MSDRTSPGGDPFNGNCFLVAIQVMMRVPGSKLVHGLPRYRRPGPDQGKRYWHAWVEVNLDGMQFVLDLSNGQEVRALRHEFYHAGDIEQVFRYTRNQVEAMVRKHENAGPWVPNWENYEDESFRGVGIG